MPPTHGWAGRAKRDELMNTDPFIHSDPAILTGKPVIHGTRLSVEFLAGFLKAGWTDEQVLDSHPHLPPEALQAVRATMERHTRPESTDARAPYGGSNAAAKRRCVSHPHAAV
jgi:uncharacterized protein (DUF433 family)